MVEIVKQNYEGNKLIYENIVKSLREVLPKEISIDWAGSTAIPSIEYGKNIMDILVGANSKDDFNFIYEKLKTIGYIPSQKSKDDTYQFFSSTEKETKHGDIHIHLVLKDTERYKEFLILKKYLLNNLKEAKNYSNKKIELISNGINERKEYKNEKSKYVNDLLERAKNWNERI